MKTWRVDYLLRGDEHMMKVEAETQEEAQLKATDTILGWFTAGIEILSVTRTTKRTGPIFADAD